MNLKAVYRVITQRKFLRIPYKGVLMQLSNQADCWSTIYKNRWDLAE